MTVKQTYCDYDTSRGFAPSEGLGCFKGKIARKVTIIYNNMEQDVLHLCSSCYRRLRVLALRQGYEIESEEV